MVPWLKDILNGVKSIKRMLARRLLSVFWKIENVSNYDRNNVYISTEIMTGEYLVEKYLGKADEEMLDIFAEKAAELNNVEVNERLLEETTKSEGKTKYLRTLLNVYPEKALLLYYEIASEKNSIPDYNGKIQ